MVALGARSEVQLARRHLPDCIPYWTDTLWISDNKTATNTDALLPHGGGRPSCFHSSSATRRSLQHGTPTPLRGSRNPSGGFHGGCASLAAPQPVNSRCIVKILVAIGSHGPLCLPSRASSWLLLKAGPAAISRLSYERPAAHYTTAAIRGLWSAASRYLLPHCVAEGTWPFFYAVRTPHVREVCRRAILQRW